MSDGFKGSCLCGQVTFEVSGPFTRFYTCHCSRCRKISGASNAANIFAASGATTWRSGEQLVTSFALSDASYFNAAFCKVCGSPVPRRARSGDFEIIPAGSLDDPPPIMPDQAIFWDDRAPWFDASCQAKRYNGYGPTLPSV
jgi:hypothetical protein